MVLNQNQVSSKHLKMRLSRRYISQVFFLLGVSPERVMNDSQIVEVKKTVLKEGESLNDGMSKFGIYKKNGSKLRINKNHKYYYQIQQGNSTVMDVTFRLSFETLI